MSTLYDAEQKLIVERAALILEIGTGGCNNDEKPTDWHAMQYRHRVGVVEGLDKALRIIKLLQSGVED